MQPNGALGQTSARRSDEQADGGCGVGSGGAAAMQMDVAGISFNARGRRGRSPGADVAGVSPVPVQMWTYRREYLPIACRNLDAYSQRGVGAAFGLRLRLGDAVGRLRRPPLLLLPQQLLTSRIDFLRRAAARYPRASERVGAAEGAGAQSRCRCGWGKPSPGADVAAG